MPLPYRILVGHGKNNTVYTSVCSGEEHYILLVLLLVIGEAVVRAGIRIVPGRNNTIYTCVCCQVASGFGRNNTIRNGRRYCHSGHVLKR